ncbi:MAG: serine acetyltransferase [bacterium]|nr:serine acetyltransferase [bacterium]
MGLWREIRDDWAWYRRPVGRQAGQFPLRAPGFWVVANYRLGAWAARRRAAGGLAAVAGVAAGLIYALTNFCVSTVTSSDVRPGAVIGRRLTVHTTRGLLITNGVRLGDDCMVNNGVCIVGRANGRGEGVPAIGNDVVIGVGAKVLGEITVGDHAVIGANAVVLRDVPAGSLAVGVPAVAKPRDDSADRAEVAKGEKDA